MKKCIQKLSEITCVFYNFGVSHHRLALTGAL